MVAKTGVQMDLALVSLLDHSNEVTVRNGRWVIPSVHL